MKHHTMAWLLGSVALMAGAGGVHAQTIYRIVGADGKVTFSDKPPVSADQGRVAATGVGSSTTNSGAALPFELKQVASKYPVTLYTGSQCLPCDSGRAALVARGIPFAERTVNTPDDTDYLQRLSGDTSLPYLTIGGKRIKGFSSSEWTQYLDAAGYPEASQLPASYKNAAPTPLVALPKAAPAAPKVAEPSAPSLPSPPQPTYNPANPAGITF